MCGQFGMAHLIQRNKILPPFSMRRQIGQILPDDQDAAQREHGTKEKRVNVSTNKPHDVLLTAFGLPIQRLINLNICGALRIVTGVALAGNGATPANRRRICTEKIWGEGVALRWLNFW